MAKSKQEKVMQEEIATTFAEQSRLAQADLLLRRHKKFKPLPVFRGSCKNC